MKPILGCFLAMSVYSISIAAPLIIQTSLPQTETLQKVQDSEALKLVKQGEQEFKQGQSEKAFETFQQALKLAQKVGDRYAEGEALNNIAFMYNFRGQSQKALEIYNQALPIRREIGDRKGEGITVNNMGEVYFRLGQSDKAFDYFSQAVTIFEEIGNKDLVTTAINNMNKTLSQKQQEVSNLEQEGKQQIEKGQYQEAIKTYQQVLVIGKKLKDKETEASALHMLALSHDNLEHYQQALDYYNQVLPLDREIGDQESVVNTLNGIGSIYNTLNQHEKVIEILQEALRIAKKVNYQGGELNALMILGLSHKALFQNEQSLDNLNQALSILKKKNDLAGQITVLSYISSVYKAMGKYQNTLDYLNQSLFISEKINDSSSIGFALDSIGSIYYDIGRLDKALEYLEKALSIEKKINDRKGIGKTLYRIGMVYNNLGDYKKAMDYFEKALSIRREVKDRSGESVTLTKISSLQDDIGQSEKALENLNQSLEILKGLNDELKVDRSGEIVALSNIGYVYDKMGNSQKALEIFNDALSQARKMDFLLGEANILSGIGTAYRSLKNPQKALDNLNQALLIQQKIGDRYGEAGILASLGFVYRDLNQPTKAIDTWEKSANISLEMRKGFQRENRQAFLQSYLPKSSAIALIDLLIKQNQPEKAFEWANRFTTADLANYDRLIDAKVADPEIQKAIDNWEANNQKLNILRQQLQKNYSDEAARQMRDFEAKVYQEAENIREKYPEVAELFENKPADITKLRNNIPQDTVIIQPVLLTEVEKVSSTIAIFVLTKDDLKVTQISISPTDFSQLITQYRAQLEDDQNSNYNKTGEKLYDILIRPIEAQIQSNSPKKIAIIATDKLRYISFEALYDAKTNQYLLQKYPIHYITRISTSRTSQGMTFLRIISNGIILGSFVIIIGGVGIWVIRKFGILPATILVIILGGLTFFFIAKSQVNRVLVFANPKPTQQELKGTEIEAENISKIFPESQKYIGTDATIENFKNRASLFPILHLGTHGCFNQNGCPKLGMNANTILFANNQQYNIADAALLGLKNTELIILSACETAKEANSNGQEISGLGYVLERAGAKSVIASLWNAEDKTSADIMTQFYQNFRNGMEKSEAMRQAKLSHIKEHPFFWSHFILIGDAM